MIISFILELINSIASQVLNQLFATCKRKVVMIFRNKTKRLIIQQPEYIHFKTGQREINYTGYKINTKISRQVHLCVIQTFVGMQYHNTSLEKHENGHSTTKVGGEIISILQNQATLQSGNCKETKE